MYLFLEWKRADVRGFRLRAKRFGGPAVALAAGSRLAARG